MFERFTERARQVIVYAQEESRGLDHSYIGTEHLLLGLMREEEGLAAQVLVLLGLGLEDVRRRIRLIVGTGGPASPPTGQIPFTPRSKKILETALREALAMGHNYIGTEHLLLSLVRDNEGIAARILADLNVDRDHVRTEVVRLLTGRAHRHGEAPPIVRSAPPDTRELLVAELLKAWKAHPNMRLCQLVVNVADTTDPFYVDDVEFAAKLRAWTAPS